MKKAVALLCALLTASLAWGQAKTSCPQFSSTHTAPDLTPPDTNQHITGSHLFNGGATESCTYASTGGKYCSTNALVTPFGAVSESGTLKTFPLGVHKGNAAFNPGQQFNPAGAATANGTLGAAVLWCPDSTCAVTISLSPLSFPVGAVWTHGPNFSIVCPAVLDPQYKNCTGVDCHCCTCIKQGENTSAAGCASPIIVDVKGTGFHLGAQAVFDIRGDGKPELVRWPSPESGNAFLVLDRDGNGLIDSGKELFGNYTRQSMCPERLKNGFRALDEFDSNGDMIIDSRDPVFTKLRLWVDANADGISQPSELHPLPELGVYSLALQYSESPKTDIYGDSFKLKARVNPEGEPNGDRVNRWTYDVWLVTESDTQHGEVKLGTEAVIQAEN
jgi:hypothetical protein